MSPPDLDRALLALLVRFRDEVVHLVNRLCSPLSADCFFPPASLAL